MITAHCHQMYNIIMEFIHPIAHKGMEVDRAVCMSGYLQMQQIFLHRRKFCQYQLCQPLKLTHVPESGTSNF